MCTTNLFVFFLCCFASPLLATKISGISDEPTGAWNWTVTDLLRRTLLPGYDPLTRPAGLEETTPMRVTLTIRHLRIDEDKSTATLIGWMRMTWQDSKLHWNASDFEGLETIRLSPSEIWIPDIELYNPAAKGATIGVHAKVLVYPDGTVLWVPQFRFDVYCNLDFKFWPRDSQTCRFVLGSWTHHSLELNLQFDNNEGYETESKSDTEIGTWKIMNIDTERLVQHYNCCAIPYIALQYDITVERRGAAHVLVNELPVIALSVLLIAAAVREPSSRGLLYAAVAIVSSIYMVSISLQVPSMNDRVPRVAMFYCALLGLAAIWGLSSAIVDRLSKRDRPVPGGLRRFLRKSNLNVASEENGVSMSPENAKPAPPADDSWSRIAVLVDRSSFFIGTILFIVLLIIHV